MRCGSFNEIGVNEEPFNGMGIYDATATQAASWHLVAAVATCLVSALWNVRQRVTALHSAPWTVRQLVAKTVNSEWHLLNIIGQSISAAWDVTGGVMALVRVRWNVAFKPRQTSGLVANGTSGVLVRHTETTKIGGV